MSESSLRPTKLYVDLNAIASNISLIKKICPNCEIMAVVKANCYGLGAIPIVKKLSDEKLVTFFGVATLSEGLELRGFGNKDKILILGPLTKNELKIAIKNNLTPTIFSFESFINLTEVIKETKKSISFHLKIETGMGRLGVIKEELQNILNYLKKEKRLIIEGIFSNLSSADDLKSKKTEKQLKKFLEAVKMIRKDGLNPIYLHMANSAGLFFHPSVRLNLVRPGLSMYGLLPNEELKNENLKDVLKFETQICQIKTFRKGSEIGYGGRYITKRKEKIAVLPVGYADGLPRILSERGGYVLIKGKRAKMVGRISMDLCTIDVTDIECKVGDTVILWGNSFGEKITPWDWAKWSQTIPYEILCHIGRRVPRIYLN